MLHHLKSFSVIGRDGHFVCDDHGTPYDHDVGATYFHNLWVMKYSTPPTLLFVRFPVVGWVRVACLCYEQLTPGWHHFLCQ